ncbi:hypothetical protein LINPERHAP2_LOCUS15147, partial [Linum perenne]
DITSLLNPPPHRPLTLSLLILLFFHPFILISHLNPPTPTPPPTTDITSLLNPPPHRPLTLSLLILLFFHPFILISHLNPPTPHRPPPHRPNAAFSPQPRPPPIAISTNAAPIPTPLILLLFIPSFLFPFKQIHRRHRILFTWSVPSFSHRTSSPPPVLSSVIHFDVIDPFFVACRSPVSPSEFTRSVPSFPFVVQSADVLAATS